MSGEQRDALADAIADKVLEKSKTRQCLICTTDERRATQHQAHHDFMRRWIMPTVDDVQGGFRKGLVVGIFIMLFIGVAVVIGLPVIAKKLLGF